jgi:hypothetical protein
MWIWVEKHNKVAEELYDLKEHSQSKPSLEEDGFELTRLRDKNNALWAVYKTCIGCKHCPTNGILYGCDIQHHVNLSGHCNQKEVEPSSI